MEWHHHFGTAIEKIPSCQFLQSTHMVSVKMRDKHQVNRQLPVKNLVDFSLQQHGAITSTTIINHVVAIVSLTDFFRKEASMPYWVYRSEYFHFTIQSFSFLPNIPPEYLYLLWRFRQRQTLGNHEVDESELIHYPV